MQYILYPRIPSPVVNLRISEVSDANITSLPDKDILPDDLAGYDYSPTGGHRVQYSHLMQLRETLIGTAKDYGFPDMVDMESRRQFEVSAGRLLLSKMGLTPNEASRNGLWPFICCDLVPDLVRWRFPGTKGKTSAERFSDGVRNTFGRLWWRTYVFEGNHDEIFHGYNILSQLGEDEIVQLMERPIMRANVRLTRIFSEQFIKTINENRVLSRTDIMRDARKRLNRLQPILCFEAIESDKMVSIISRIFDDTVLKLSNKQLDR